MTELIFLEVDFLANKDLISGQLIHPYLPITRTEILAFSWNPLIDCNFTLSCSVFKNKKHRGRGSMDCFFLKKYFLPLDIFSMLNISKDLFYSFTLKYLKIFCFSCKRVRHSLFHNQSNSLIALLPRLRYHPEVTSFQTMPDRSIL